MIVEFPAAVVSNKEAIICSIILHEQFLGFSATEAVSLCEFRFKSERVRWHWVENLDGVHVLE
jgi:hypothetical protein